MDELKKLAGSVEVTEETEKELSNGKGDDEDE